MTYHHIGDELIAREGYAGLGAAPGATEPTKEPSTFSKVTGLVTDALNIYSGQQKSAGELKAYQTIAQQQAAARAGSGMPSWLLPVLVVGGLGVVALVVLKGKRRNPAPGRRRRRRRSRRHSRR